MQRIRHLFNTIGTNWSEQPAARGAAKMAAGAVLAAEGLFGVVSNRVRRRSRGAGGIFGAVVGVIVGVVFVVVGSFMATDIEDEQRTTGTVVDVEERVNDEGNTQYTPTYAYEVDGQEYSFRSSVSTSRRPSIGSEVEIGYDPTNPDIAQRVDGIEGNFHLIFMGVGGLVALISFVQLLISLALLILGIKLFTDGRKERAEAGEDKQGFFADLFSLAKRARNGEIDVESTAAGTKGASVGATDAATRFLAGVGASGGPHPPSAHAPEAAVDVAPPAGTQPTPTSPPPGQTAAGPPPGWYDDPDRNGGHRWWDGARWTEHRSAPTQPPPPGTPPAPPS